MCECHTPKKDKAGTLQANEQSAQALLSNSGPKTRPVGFANAVVTSSLNRDSFWLAELSDKTPNELPPPVIEINAVIEQFEDPRPGNIKLYDSGATWHISPYREDFIDYTPFPTPVSLNAANKQCFPALGSGSLIIQVPNNGTMMRLTLYNVLHAPAVTYTLDRKSTRLNSSHRSLSRMPSSA